MIRSLAWVLPIVLLCGAPTAAEQAADLVRLLPRDANAVAIIRVADILQTERAVRENWAARQAEEFLSGAAVVPPSVELLVVGSLVHPSVPEEVWSAGLVVLPQTTPFATVAQHEGGKVEALVGLKSVRGSRDALFVELRPGLIGVMAPAFRQDAARWARRIKEGDTAGVSPFLQAAASQPGHIVLAMDLQDMLDPERVSLRLSADESIAGQLATRVQLGTQLMRIQGGVLTINLSDTIDAEVAFTFADPLAGDSAEVLRNVFLAVLGDMGAGIEEFDTAAASIDGNRLLLKTAFSESSLRRILSLIVTPAPSRGSVASPATTVAPPSATPSSTAPAPGKSSQKNPSAVYLAAVNKAIDDLRIVNRRAKEYERTATWHENFARRIENLPVTGVDPELLDYGQQVAAQMRALAASLRGQGVNVNMQAKTFTYTTQFDPGWTAINVWGGAGYRTPSYNVESNLREVRERQAAAVTAGADQRNQIWQMIDNERAAIEQAMRRKYGDDFVK